MNTHAQYVNISIRWIQVIKVQTEVYSRISGYFRPVSQWNRGKKEEFKDRKNLKFEGFQMVKSDAPETL